jgi:hypothetical protein
MKNVFYFYLITLKYNITKHRHLLKVLMICTKLIVINCLIQKASFRFSFFKARF